MKKISFFLFASLLALIFSCQKEIQVNPNLSTDSNFVVKNRTASCEYESNLEKAFCIKETPLEEILFVFGGRSYSGNLDIPSKLSAFQPAIEDGGWIKVQNGTEELDVFPYYENEEDIAFYINDWSEGNDGVIVSKGETTLEYNLPAGLPENLQILPFLANEFSNEGDFNQIEQSILPYGSATSSEDNWDINLNADATFPNTGTGPYFDVKPPCLNFKERAIDKYLKAWGLADRIGDQDLRSNVWNLLGQENGQECGNCAENQFDMVKDFLTFSNAFLSDEEKEAVKRNFIAKMLNLNEAEASSFFNFGDNNPILTCLLWNTISTEEICEIGFDIAGIADAIINDGFMDVCQADLSSNDLINNALSELSCDDPNSNEPIIGLLISDFRDKLNDKYEWIQFNYLEKCPRLKCAYEKLAEIGLCSEIFEKYEELEGSFDLIIQYDYDCDSHPLSGNLGYVTAPDGNCVFSGNLNDYAYAAPFPNCDDGVCNPFSINLWNKHLCTYGNDMEFASIIIHELLHSELHRWVAEANSNITSWRDFRTTTQFWKDIVVKKYGEDTPTNQHKLIEYFRDRIIKDLMLLNGDTDMSQENLDRYYMLVYELLSKPYPSPDPPNKNDDLVELGFLTVDEYNYYLSKKDELVSNDIFSNCD